MNEWFEAIEFTYTNAHGDITICSIKRDGGVQRDEVEELFEQFSRALGYVEDTDGN